MSFKNKFKLHLKKGKDKAPEGKDDSDKKGDCESDMKKKIFAQNAKK